MFFTRFNFTIYFNLEPRTVKQLACLDAMIQFTTFPVQRPSCCQSSPSPQIVETSWRQFYELSRQKLLPQVTPNLQYVPSLLHQRTIQWDHSRPSSGHPGIQKLQLSRMPSGGLHSVQISVFTKSCTICSQSMKPQQLPACLLEPLPTP